MGEIADILEASVVVDEDCAEMQMCAAARVNRRRLGLL
jgi:hypothetical protein